MRPATSVLAVVVGLMVAALVLVAGFPAVMPMRAAVVIIGLGSHLVAARLEVRQGGTEERESGQESQQTTTSAATRW
jgi:hypothetical protein